MTPVPALVFWIVGAAAAIVALATPAFRVLDRLGKIEERITELSTDVRWIKRGIGMNGKEHETPARS